MAGRMPGTAALKIVADDETGELKSATILGSVQRDAGRIRREPTRQIGLDR
jgi:hypothetical protein